MSLAPVHEQVTKPILKPPVLPPNDKKVWQQVLKPATMLWERIKDDKRIAPEIRTVTGEWRKYLLSLGA